MIRGTGWGSVNTICLSFLEFAVELADIFMLTVTAKIHVLLSDVNIALV